MMVIDYITDGTNNDNFLGDIFNAPLSEIKRNDTYYMTIENAQNSTNIAFIIIIVVVVAVFSL